MAKNTNISLRSKLIYQVFVRNHSDKGDFQGLIEDLDRIKNLSVDFLYLMPIHPISKKNRKGTLGSSYAIADYYGINAEYGTLEDFCLLIDEVHKRDMQLWIDVVFNHSGCDNVWVEKHPEYYYRDSKGNFGNKIGEWIDVYDLDFNNEELQNELIKVLEYWTKLGVDGYRCDVASLVPLKFWQKVDIEIKKINHNIVWLAESVHLQFVDSARMAGFTALSDSELYEVFDIEYNYDVHNEYLGYFKKENTLLEYKKAIYRQQCIYPDNFIKTYCLENHDLERIHSLTKGDKAKTLNWLAYSFFIKGTAFVYAGQESFTEKFCDQFEDNKINRDFDDNYCKLIRKLKELKNLPEVIAGKMEIDQNDDEVIRLKYHGENKIIVGIFNVGQVNGKYNIDIKKGVYKNMLNGQDIIVENNELSLSSEPMIFAVAR